MKTRLFLAMAGLLLAAGLFAQTGSVSGSVSDKETGEPLLFANVALSQDGVLVNGTQTDFDGNYIIESIAPGTYELKFSYVGYESLTVDHLEVFAGQEAIVSPKMKTGAPIIYCDFFINQPPLIEIDGFSSGHTFSADDIRRMGRRQ